MHREARSVCGWIPKVWPKAYILQLQRGHTLKNQCFDIYIAQPKPILPNPSLLVSSLSIVLEGMLLACSMPEATASHLFFFP